MGFLKKITKPISKFLDKVVPNEVKPFLPYAAAAAPFLLPPGIAGGSGLGALLRRGALTGGLNLAAQLAQEGSEGDFSIGSLGLASLTGALTTPGSSELLGARAGIAAEQPGILSKIKSSGLQTLSKGAGFLEKGAEALRTDPFSPAGLKAATVPVTQGTTDIAVAGARREQKAYDEALAEFNKMQKEMSGATYNDYYDNILKYMDLAGFTAEEAEAAAERVLSGINFANGGRVGFAQGTNKKMMIVDLLNKGADFDLIKTITEASDQEIMEAIDFFKYGGAEVPLPTFDDKGNMIDDGLYKGRETRPEAKAYGGRVGYLGGGNVATPPGMEMDLRVGGFIPIGQAERADDVLARVSKNEFVMTADAVRGMGNGDPRAGAQKMYQLMNNLEARV